MGIKYRTFLDGYEKVYVCSKCKTHLTTNTMLLSKVLCGLVFLIPNDSLKTATTTTNGNT
jgi:hypothetical protein